MPMYFARCPGFARAAVLIACLSGAASLQAGRSAVRIVFVDAALTTGAGDGSSWTNAFKGRLGLQQALTSIAPAPGRSAQVWVADGEYAPAPAGGNHMISFQLRSGIEVYGGFAGGETSLAQRDPVRNVATLTGDLNSNDVVPPPLSMDGMFENSSHVVRITDADATCVLDGVTIRSGFALSDEDIFKTIGANVLIEGGTPTIHACVMTLGQSKGGSGMAAVQSANPAVNDCLFIANTANGGFGGGVLIEQDCTGTFSDCRFEANLASTGGGLLNKGQPLIQDCLFIANKAGQRGGGLFDSAARPRIERCRFIMNSASGGGVYLALSDATIRDCDFVGNIPDGAGGGAAFVDGGFVPSADDPEFINCRFVGNNGVLLLNFDASVDFINCTIAHNSLDVGLPLWPTFLIGTRAPGSFHLRNCIVHGNPPFTLGSIGGPGLSGVFVCDAGPQSALIDDSLVEFWDGSLAGTGTFAAAPAFVDPDGADGIPGTEDDDLHLTAASPAVDAGDGAALPRDVKVDFDGADRFVDGDGSGAAEVDLGAFELQIPNPADLNGDGHVDGFDLALLLGQWGRCAAKATPGQCAADLDGSGAVNGFDLGLLLGAWG